MYSTREGFGDGELTICRRVFSSFSLANFDSGDSGSSLSVGGLLSLVTAGEVDGCKLDFAVSEAGLRSGRRSAVEPWLSLNGLFGGLGQEGSIFLVLMQE